MRVAVNGFGRIGRAVLRVGWDRPDVEFVAINDLAAPEMLAYLLKHDSVHGRWAKDVALDDGALVIDGRRVPLTSAADPSTLPWAKLDVDLVIECTGRFTSRDKAAQHLAAGARRVLISAPGKGVDATFVYGVNHHGYDPAAHRVISSASCTTNCLAPVARALHVSFAIQHGMMATVHAYTMDQNLLDGPHREGKLRRARAAALNIVPTTTGAAKAIGLVIPELAGRLDGISYRVPTPDGSLVDFVCNVSRDTTAEEVLAVLDAAAAGPMKGVMVVERTPIVSQDIVGHPASSIVDAESTDVLGGRMVKVVSWYDNEWGFSHRLLDLVNLIGAAE